MQGRSTLHQLGILNNLAAPPHRHPRVERCPSVPNAVSLENRVHVKQLHSRQHIAPVRVQTSKIYNIIKRLHRETTQDVTVVSFLDTRTSRKYAQSFYRPFKWPYFSKETTTEQGPMRVKRMVQRKERSYIIEDPFAIMHVTYKYSRRQNFNSIPALTPINSDRPGKELRENRKRGLLDYLFVYHLHANAEQHDSWEAESHQWLSKKTEYDRSEQADNAEVEKLIKHSEYLHKDWDNPEDAINLKDSMYVGKGNEFAKNCISELDASETRHYFPKKPTTSLNSKNQNNRKHNGNYRNIGLFRIHFVWIHHRTLYKIHAYWTQALGQIYLEKFLRPGVEPPIDQPQ